MSKSSSEQESKVYTVKAQRSDGSIITIAVYSDPIQAQLRLETVYGTFEYGGVWIG